MNEHEYFAKMRQKAYLVVKGLSLHTVMYHSMHVYNSNSDSIIM